MDRGDFSRRIDWNPRVTPEITFAPPPLALPTIDFRLPTLPPIIWKLPTGFRNITPAPLTIPTTIPITTITPAVTNTPTPTIYPVASPNKYSPRVYYLIFNPILESKEGKRLTEYLGWNDPRALIQEYINDIKNSSWGLMNFQLAYINEVDVYPLKNDGFTYTDQTYLDCWNNNSTCHSPDGANYNKIISDYDICNLVNQDKIDELWMVGGPWFGFWEANMTGPGSIWTNGPIVTNTSCNRPIHIMGFANHVGTDMMLEDFGHRIEGALNTYIGNNTGSPWASYQTTYALNPNLPVYGCGNVHAPPNATGGYDRSNATRYVTSSCIDWLNYPNFKGATEYINCDPWGCTTQGYLNWWMKHLPHASPSWWDYISTAKPE